MKIVTLLSVTTGILLVCVGYQTIQLRTAVAELARVESQHRMDVTRREILERTVVEGIAEAIGEARSEDAVVEAVGGLPPDGLVIVADTKCLACGEAVRALQERGRVHFEVVSFVDPRSETRRWLKDLGVDREPLVAEATRGLLPNLPTGVTPVMIEFAKGQPVRLHIGQPLPSWLQEGAAADVGLNGGGV